MSAIPADCVARIAEAQGEKADKSNLKRVQSDMDKLLREVLLEGLQGSDGLRIAAERFAQQEQLAGLIEKRNAHLNFLRFNERLGYIRTVWKGDIPEGLRSVLTGSVRGRKGARASVALEQKQLSKQYHAQVTTEIERAGLMATFRRGTLDDDIADSLWQITSKSPNLDGIPKDAVTLAKIIHKAQEVARTNANKAGSWIGKIDGYITRQSHDSFKLAKRGMDEWMASIDPKLDWARIEADHGAIANKREWLAKTYNNIVSGVHLKSEGAVKTTGFKGPGNLAKKMSQERILHFKSASDWMAYNKDFGTGNLREAIWRGLDSSAKNTGLMRVLGPNPEALYNRLVSQLQRDIDGLGDVEQMGKFQRATGDTGYLTNRVKEVTGQTSQSVNHMWARWLSNLRAIQSMAKLGLAVISSVTDIATYAADMHYQGRGFLSGMGEAMGAIVRGRPKGEQKEILSSLGVFFESLSGDITRQGSLDESFGGYTSRAMQQYFKWNLLNWWTESLRGSAALSMSHHLGLQAGKSFDAMPKELRHALSLYDITAKDWDAIRANGIKVDSDGKAFAVTDNLEPEQADKLRRYYVDRSEQAVLEVDADSRAMLRRGSKAGTIEGEAIRMIAQFKGFPVAFTRQVLGREVYGRGAEAFAEGSIKGLAKLITATTVLGYAAMTAKDLVKGKTPREPSKKTILAAMMQGGGAGIYGDFLFGEYSRVGSSPVETVAGPLMSTAGDAIRIWSGLVHEDSKGDYLTNRDAGDALRFAIDNTPFLNLFYTRALLNYAILYDIQEAVSPGTLRRMERRAAKENGQTFLAPPSQDRLRPFTD